jgi:Diacylglycerol kinase catalytic domain
VVDVVVLLSGDGLVHEFVNGLYARSPGDGVVRPCTAHWPVIGILPCGTGNGVAFSHGFASRDPIHLAMQLCEARATPIEWMRCEVEDASRPVHSLLSVMGGLAATSEYYMEQRLRFVPWPSVRDVLGPVLVLLGNSAHRMEVRMRLSAEHFALPLDSALTSKDVLREDGDEYVYEVRWSHCLPGVRCVDVSARVPCVVGFSFFFFLFAWWPAAHHTSRRCVATRCGYGSSRVSLFAFCYFLCAELSFLSSLSCYTHTHTHTHTGRTVVFDFE